MRVTDRQFLALKRLQILTGVVPVGLFLLAHFSINGRAIAGRAAYLGAAERLARLPALAAIEAIAIGLPILLHIAAGIVIGLTRQNLTEPPFPNPRLRWVQRSTGFYLAMFVVFHVWALRLSPDRHSEADLFDLAAGQLRDPAVFALNALAVLAAGLHFALGCLALAGPNAFRWPAPGAMLARIAGVAGLVFLSALGLNALLAFVWAPARWLAPH